jgi:hypothetical protein
MTDKHLEMLAWFFRQETLTQADIHAIHGIRKFYCEKRKLNSLHYKTLRSIATKRRFAIWNNKTMNWDFSVLEPEVVEKIVKVPAKTTTRKKTTTKKENNNVVSSKEHNEKETKTRSKKAQVEKTDD